MKKAISLMLALLLCLSLCACGGSKEETPAPTEEAAPVEETPVEETPAEEPVEEAPVAETPEDPAQSEEVYTGATVGVYVSISDAGILRVANEQVFAKDPDGDGKVTADAVIAAAHESFYDGKDEKPFLFEETDFGMSIVRLWGVENGGSYGYYVNDAYVLPDYKLVEGDYLCAYSYADLAGWSDCYAFFDKRNLELNAGESFSLTISQLVYDDNWELQTQLAEGATIIINGEVSSFLTDASGNATITLPDAGTYVISAVGAEGNTIVPPVCLVTVN